MQIYIIKVFTNSSYYEEYDEFTFKTAYKCREKAEEKAKQLTSMMTKYWELRMDDDEDDPYGHLSDSERELLEELFRQFPYKSFKDEAYSEYKIYMLELE